MVPEVERVFDAVAELRYVLEIRDPSPIGTVCEDFRPFD